MPFPHLKVCEIRSRSGRQLEPRQIRLCGKEKIVLFVLAQNTVHISTASAYSKAGAIVRSFKDETCISLRRAGFPDNIERFGLNAVHRNGILLVPVRVQIDTS